MKKKKRKIKILVGIAFSIIAFVNILLNYSVPNNKNQIFHIQHVAGLTSCSAECDGGYNISVTDCQFCESISNDKVECFDENGNMIDWDYCVPVG